MDNLIKTVVTNVTDLITVPTDKTHNHYMHKRKYYGLSFCEEGQITYTHNGKEYVSDRNHAIILPEGGTYHIQGNKKGVFYVVNFTCAKPLCNTLMPLPIKNVESFKKDFEQMKSLMLFDKNRAKVISIFYNMLHRLSNFENNTQNILYPAIRYLEESPFYSDISNKNLAAICNISEVYFRKLFTKMYGTTPAQYILDLKINKAKQLLTDGILKINALSEQCGFKSQYHFSRIFKNKVGLTPTEYMKENKVYKI